MDENKEKKLRQLQSMTESLCYGCDDLMGCMQIDNGHGLTEDEEAFIAIGELGELVDRYRCRLKDILEKSCKINTEVKVEQK